MNSSRRTPQSECGSIVLEAALLVPALLAIAFFAFEFSYSLRTQELSASLSRELALEVFRGCTAALPRDITQPPNDDFGVCVDKAIQDFREETAGIAPNSTLTVSIYRASDAGTIASPFVFGDAAKTRFSALAMAQPGNASGNAVRANRRVAIAEVSLPLPAFYPRIFGFNLVRLQEAYGFTLL